MEHYIPPYCPPCEPYWQRLLAEGPVSNGGALEVWEWVEAPEVRLEIWEEAGELERRHTILELTIDDYNRGGLITHWKDIECFVPASHLRDYPFPADPEARKGCFAKYLNKVLCLCMIEVEPARDRILLSEREAGECEADDTQWPDWLCIGSTTEGTVTSVRPFGAFVDIGPLEGMVHISEISWGRVRHPQDFVAPGDRVKVKILNVDLDHQRVGLSLKRLGPNPWSAVDAHLNPGDTVSGVVASVERFGVFVELMPGIEGLLHISEVSEATYSEDLLAIYTPGEQIQVRIVDITAREHRIALTRPTTVAYGAA